MKNFLKNLKGHCFKKKYGVYNTFFNCVYATAPSLQQASDNFLDLQKVLGSPEEPLFFDFCHTKPNANKTIARHIADKMLERSSKFISGE